MSPRGKISIARVLAGTYGDGTIVHGPHGEDRIAGVFSLLGGQHTKRGAATAGEVAAFGRLENAQTGDTLTTDEGVQGAVKAP